ncbi:hypothetical protein [Actinoplanes sp. NPDC048796]|uniref:hypothetical protein n=1 Tax=unclassified Actinoplanes TaxID=2626549 RepID=UPI003405FB94
MRFGGGIDDAPSGLGIRAAGPNPAPSEGAGQFGRAENAGQFNRAENAGQLNRAENAGQLNRAPGEGSGLLNRAPEAGHVPAGGAGRPNRPRLEAPNMGQVNRPLGGDDGQPDGADGPSA